MNRRSKLMRREGIAGLLFVTPQLIYFLLFFLLPLGICIYAGFTKRWQLGRERNGLILHVFNHQVAIA